MTVNNINGRKYIGKRQCKCDIEQDKYIGSGKVLKQAIKKYGKENFSKNILEICESEIQCNDREKYWINFYNATQNKEFYNIASGGNGGNTYAGLTNKELSKILLKKSIGSKGENNPRYGKVVTDATKQKISNSLKELYSNPENCSRYGKFGKDNPCSKTIKCIELNEIFYGIRDASRKLNIPSPNITRALKDGEKFSAGVINGTKLHWEYYNNKEGT